MRRLTITNEAVLKLISTSWEIGNALDDRMKKFLTLPVDDIQVRRFEVFDKIANAIVAAGYKVSAHGCDWLQVDDSYHLIRFRVWHHHTSVHSTEYPYRRLRPTGNLQLDYAFHHLAREPKTDLIDFIPKLVAKIERDYQKFEKLRQSHELMDRDHAAQQAVRAEHHHLMERQQKTVEAFQEMALARQQAKQLRAFLEEILESDTAGYSEVIDFLSKRIDHMDPLARRADPILGRLDRLLRGA